MNPEPKLKWRRALRSGAYRQGRQVLRDDNNCYCAFGVLYQVFLDEHGLEWPSKGPGCWLYYPPEEALQWAGLSSIVTLNHPELGTKPLALLNDSYHIDFDELADLIEEQL